MNLFIVHFIICYNEDRTNTNNNEQTMITKYNYKFIAQITFTTIHAYDVRKRL